MTTLGSKIVQIVCLGGAFAFFTDLAVADELALSLAGTRTKFLISEPIEFAAVDAGGKTLEIRHADGSSISLQLPVQGGPVSFLPDSFKPGEYTASVGDKSVKFSVHNDKRPNESCSPTRGR